MRSADAYVCVSSEELGRRAGVQSSLEWSRDMSASRASLSLLDDVDDDASLRHQPGDDVITDDDDRYARRHKSPMNVRIRQPDLSHGQFRWSLKTFILSIRAMQQY